ncbi:hypothetical protein CRG98_035478 [Punica granatum]|uniref:Uncharacterized protein n=1 Tax=Punica granatum TaxID=22663 RepID=A0A2I0IJH1_PUNGR|nr:hypothetical protein CRG98_035478 [Punica granatum]
MRAFGALPRNSLYSVPLLPSSNPTKPTPTLLWLAPLPPFFTGSTRISGRKPNLLCPVERALTLFDILKLKNKKLSFIFFFEKMNSSFSEPGSRATQGSKTHGWVCAGLANPTLGVASPPSRRTQA